MPLEPIGENAWLAEGGNVSFYGFPYNTRSVIVRLTSGDLWVWSPIALSEGLRTEVEALGPVRHLVSPNPIHHLFLGEWQHAFPEARLWGPQSTITKRKDLVFEAALDQSVPEEWRQDMDLVRFYGSSFMDEVVFFHRFSRTVIFADLSENFSDDFLRAHWPWWARFIARIWKIREPWGYAPLEWRLSWWRRAPARQALERVLAWQPERVVMAHGEWQRSNGVAYVERVFAWLR